MECPHRPEPLLLQLPGFYTNALGPGRRLLGENRDCVAADVGFDRELLIGGLEQVGGHLIVVVVAAAGSPLQVTLVRVEVGATLKGH